MIYLLHLVLNLDYKQENDSIGWFLIAEGGER